MPDAASRKRAASAPDIPHPGTRSIRGVPAPGRNQSGPSESGSAARRWRSSLDMKPTSRRAASHRTQRLHGARMAPSTPSRLIRPFLLKPIQVLRRDVPCDVLAGETRRIELADVRIVVQARAHEILEVLIDQTIRADQPCDLLLGATGGDELGCSRDIDTVH